MRIRFRDLHGGRHDLAIAEGRWASPSGRETEIMDATDGYAVPGLVDAHTHLTGTDMESMVEGEPDVSGAMSRHALQHVEHGVLLAADKGGRDDRGLEALRFDETERPHLTVAGTITTVEGGYYEGFGRVVDPAGPIDAWIEEAMPEGAGWVKLIGDWPRKGQGALVNFELPALEAVVDAAHGAGRRVAIHTAAPRTASLAVQAGVDSIEHGLFLTEDDLRTLGGRGGAWVPTVAAMEGVRDALREGSSGQRLLDEGLDNVRQLLPVAVGYGVAVLAGTDLHLPHGAVAHEAARLASYGLAVEEAVGAVTASGYRYFGVPGGFEEGRAADLVVFAGDPREDLSMLVEPTVIIRAGRVVRR